MAEEPDADVKIGVVDTIYDPGSHKQYNRFGRSFDIIDANVGSTSGHGYAVLSILTYFTRNPEYHLFQAIDENGNSRDSYIMKAIGKAMEFGEVDVLNLSLGADHITNEDKSCSFARSDCKLCEVAEEAVDQGITIVAAAGNQPHADAVCCPSLSSLTISVGGVVTRCTAQPDPSQMSQGDSSIFRPPNAYWVYREDGKGADGIFCSERGCMPGESCQDNRETTPWKKNVYFSDRKPDTLAPVHFPVEEDNIPEIAEGTSFAAPMVTAGITSTLELARGDGDNISAEEIRHGVRSSGIDFPNIDHCHFSVQRFANSIRREKGLQPLDFDESGPFDLLYGT